MEIVDELITPGCPNCFVKHMSAALARMAECRVKRVEIEDRFADGYSFARALVNLVEAFSGYESHFDYAVGLMVKAEEVATANGMPETVKKSRAIRTNLVSAGKKGIPEAVCGLGTLVDPVELAVAHILEARRELPDMDRGERVFTVDDIRGMIEKVWNEYFAVSEVGTEEGKEVK